MGLGLKISYFPLSEWRARASTLLMLFSLDVKFQVHYPTFQANAIYVGFRLDLGSYVYVQAGLKVVRTVVTAVQTVGIPKFVLDFLEICFGCFLVG